MQNGPEPRVVDVRDLQNLRPERDFLPTKPIGITASVHSFMMVPYHRQDAAKRLQRRADFFSNDRMLPHNLRFFRIQGPWFKKDAIWHRHFPYIMKPTGYLQFPQVFLSQTETLPQPLGVSREPLRVPVPQRIFRFDTPRQR